MPSLWINDDNVFKEFKDFCEENKLNTTACATEAIEKWVKFKKELLKK